METKTIKKQVAELSSRFNCSFQHFLKTEEYIAMLDEWLEVIEKEYDQEAQPYMKLIVCNMIVRKLLYSTSDIIARCMKPVIENMDYVYDNDYDTKGEYHRVFSISGGGEKALVKALVKTFNVDEVICYMYNVIIDNCERERFPYAMHMCHLIVKSYNEIGEYANADKAGYNALKTYDDIIKVSPSSKHDSEPHRNSTLIEVSKARIELGLSNKEELKEAEALEEARKDAELKVKEDTHRRKAELMGLADQCLRDGNMEGYCGYMSALGDIGR